MRINNNLMAYNAQNKLGINNSNVSDSIRKLSSGLRISRAGDDAAGLAISEKMRAQIKGLDMASKNSQDAISLVQTAEGALNETHSILQRMRELAVQSASDTNEGIDRSALNDEFQELAAEIDDIAADTQFNNKSLLDGTFGSTITTDEITVGDASVASFSVSGPFSNGDVITIGTSGTNAGTFTATDAAGNVAVAAGTAADSATAGTLTFQFGDGRTIEIAVTDQDDFEGSADGLNGGTLAVTVDVTGNDAYIQTGANQGENLAVSIGDMSASGLGVDTLDISQRGVVTEGSETFANLAIDTLDTALNLVSTERAGLGATQNRLDHKIKNLDTSSENLQAAESRIRDLDMAAEMTEFTSANILSQAATSMLAQANSLPQNVLSLLG